MVKIKIGNDRVIPAFNELSGLQRWLRPGLLAFLVGQMVDALKSVALKLSKERLDMLDEAALKEPEFLDDAKTKPNPNAGKHITRETAQGTITVFASKEHGDEFRRREKELFEDSSSVFQIERKLTLVDIEKIERERLAKPRLDPNVKDDGEFSIDFAALLPFIETSAPEADADPAIVKPDTPAAPAAPTPPAPTP